MMVGRYFCFLLAVGLAGCARSNEVPGLPKYLLGQWRARTQHCIETDSTSHVLVERTDSSEYGLTFTPSHVLHFHARDPTEVSKREPSLLRGTTFTFPEQKGPGLPTLTLLEATPALLVLRQAMPGLNHTTLTCTITYTRVP